APARRRARRAGAVLAGSRRRRSPGGSGIGALQGLQLAQQMAEVLAVAATAAPGLHPGGGGRLQGRLVEHASDGLRPGVVKARRIDGDTLVDQAPLGAVRLEQLARERPQALHRGLGARPAVIGAVAEADYPFAGMAQMIGALLLRLGGDGGKGGVL